MLIYVSALISLLLTLILGIPYLDFLKKKTYNQFIREEGPASHQKKAGTPTMGGLIIILPAIIGAILALIMDEKTSISSLIALVTFALLTFIGLKDDFSKVNKKQNKGLGARQKLLLQILIAAIPALYVTLTGERTITFLHYSLNLGMLYPFFAIFIIIGSSNAVNLTDGLDGLASGCSVIALIAITFICGVLLKRTDLAIVSAGIAGSCAGFLYYNRNPAKVFMGDTGSLALGGIIGTLAVIGKFEILLILIGGIFVIETLSVILQVTSFKTTGKRIFKMSPIHHHFELLGWSETKVVYTFWFIEFICAVIACTIAYSLT